MNKKELIKQIYDINKYYASSGILYEYPKQWFTKKYNKDLLIYLVNNEEVAAYAAMHLYKSLPDIINLAVFGVNPKYSSKGYGRKLLDTVKNRFKSNNIVLNVHENNINAIRFYEKNGFKFIAKDELLNIMEN